MTPLQLRTLRRIIAGSTRRRWVQPLSGTEIGTLSTLHGRGLVRRRVWKPARNLPNGNRTNVVYEYQADTKAIAAARAVGIIL